MPAPVTNLVKTVVVAPATNRGELNASVLPERFSSQSEAQAWPIAGPDLESVSKAPSVPDASTTTPAA